MQPPAGSRRTVSCHGMRVSLYLPFVLLCALLMSACASEEEQAQEAQQAQEAVQKFNAPLVSERIMQQVVSRTGRSYGVGVECPDTVDKIVRLGCEATAGDPVKRVRIKVARTGEGDPEKEYRVVTKLVDTFHLEQIIRDSLGTRVPTRQLSDMECPELVEKKKGVRFVCKGEGVFEGGRYTVRVRLGFSEDGGKPTVSRVQHVPALSP